MRIYEHQETYVQKNNYWIIKASYFGGGKHLNLCQEAGFSFGFSIVSLNIDTLRGLALFGITFSRSD